MCLLTLTPCPRGLALPPLITPPPHKHPCRFFYVVVDQMIIILYDQQSLCLEKSTRSV
jgi:hypothetical protein